jgi:GAF domain-containing protein
MSGETASSPNPVPAANYNSGTSLREEQLLDTFASLADNLVAGYEVVDLLQSLVDHCVTLVDAGHAGILLPDVRGGIEVIAATAENNEFIRLLQLSATDGPAAESLASGRVVWISDLEDTDDRFGEFRELALAQGLRSTHVVPMRLRASTIGALSLFRATVGRFSEPDLIAARALADIGTIGILQERSLQDVHTFDLRVQHAVDSRIIVEQAKGVVAYLNDLSIDDAFQAIRAHARETERSILRVSEDIVERRLRI